MPARVNGVDLHEACGQLAAADDPRALIHEGSWTYSDGERFLRLLRHPSGLLADCNRLGQFLFAPDGSGIRYWRDGRTPRRLFDDYLHTTCVAIALELRGVSCLHASSVRSGRAALTFVGASGMGKSTLASALVADGAVLLADDVTPLAPTEDGYAVFPMLPRIKLDVAVAQAVLPIGQDEGEHYGKRWVHLSDRPGALDHPQATGIIALQRGEGDELVASAGRLTPITGHRAWALLAQHSYVAPLVEALGIQRAWHERLVALAASVPLWCLDYRSGLAHLPRVLRVIEQQTSDA